MKKYQIFVWGDGLMGNVPDVEELGTECENPEPMLTGHGSPCL